MNIKKRYAGIKICLFIFPPQRKRDNYSKEGITVTKGIWGNTIRREYIEITGLSERERNV